MKNLNMDSFKRTKTNIQYFGTQMMEQSIPGYLATGQVELPLVNLDQIKAKITMIPSKDRPKIGYIHLGAVRIHIQASF